MAAASSNDVPGVDRRYICIYPAYINSKKTLVGGRRIPKEKACDNPTSSEIRDVCAAAGLKPLLENKVYPRELYKYDPICRGRVKVMLKSDTDILINPKIANKKQLMLHISEMVPKLKSRVQKSGSSDAGQRNQKKKNPKRR